MNHLIEMSMSFIKTGIILTKLGWILCIELIKYLLWYHKNYEEFIVSITNKLIEINILYVKIFQAFALNNNIIDNKINNTLTRFVDNAPWTNKEIDYNLLSILEKDHDLIFDKPLSPINSGMISLVFKGKKKNTGDTIVVKIKRLNIEHNLKLAIDDLLVVLRWIMLIPCINKFQIAEIMTKNMDLIKHQTNFVQEVKNIQVFGKICKHLKYVAIPNVDAAITEKYNDIIIMDYIDGLSISKIDQEDYLSYAKLIMKFVFVSTFLHGKIHGDLHSGNILFIKDANNTSNKYKLGILDFGIIYEIGSDTKSGMYDIISNLHSVSSKELAGIILNSSIIQPLADIKDLDEEHYNHMVTIISEFVDKSINVHDNINQLEVYEFLTHLNTYIDKINADQNQRQELKQLKLKPSDDFVKIQVLFGMLHGVVLKLCDGKYVQMANEVLNELFNRSEK
jgi:predicted unusual protein kinase regulating ubiquinone biosynthesis (AarF/ABC1/UbiB family)